MDALFGTCSSSNLLIVRLTLGVIFFAHWAQKLFRWVRGRGLKATANCFQTSLRVPPALAVLMGGAGGVSVDRLIVLG